MTISEELKERGFVYQSSTENVSDIFDGEKKRTVYLGIDPTAEAIHVGNLAAYMLLNHLMRAGHSVVLLIGGGTALIGDPSGRDSERSFVDEEVVGERAGKLEKNVKALTPHGEVVFVNNLNWLRDASLLTFLRDVGKHFTVNAMIKKDSVSARLKSEQGISFTEFSYALLQSYDFYHLHETHGCDVQIGGSDQWGNISSGIDFIRRKTGEEVFGLTMPLVVDAATGKKFGKSAGNAVWLDPEMTSPFAFYQFWLNTSDSNVESYLKLFTFLSLNEIGDLLARHNADPSARMAQKKLAEETTLFVHGKETCEGVVAATAMLFEGQKQNEEILTSYAPTLTLSKDQPLIEVLVEAGLASSKREARLFVTEGGVSLDGEKIVDVDYVIVAHSSQILKRGKRHAVFLSS